MNKVQLTGRIAFMRIDEKHIQISLATQSYSSKSGQVITDFIQCVAFEGTAEFIKNNFKVGDWLEATGRIKPNTYTSQDGKKHHSQNVIINEASFVGYRRSTSEAPMENELGDFRVVDNTEELDLPWEI